MKRMSMIGALVVVTLAMTRSAQALPILDVEGALALGDPTQLGRLSRNVIGQDWAGGEPFPGVINPTTSYHYLTYVLNVGMTPFIQILFDSVSLNTFVSAYDTSYLPNSAALPNRGLDTNWLGDAGVSGNDFGTNPVFFQVLVPENHDLVIVVNNTAAGNVGVGDPFRLTVEGFIDSQFSEPAQAVPEAATGVLAMTGFVLLALTNRRRNPSVCPRPRQERANGWCAPILLPFLDRRRSDSR
jgi:hypothetical protein